MGKSRDTMFGSERYLTARGVATLLDVNPRTFQRWYRESALPGFPAHYEPKPEIRRWLCSEVEHWMRTRPRTA